MSEHAEQCAVVQWWRLQHPKLRRCLVATGNGLHLAGSKKARAIKWAAFERAGGQAGVADLELKIPRGKYHGLIIEMKTLTGRATKEQIEYLCAMTEQGYLAVVCKGSDAAIRTIQDYMQIEGSSC